MGVGLKLIWDCQEAAKEVQQSSALSSRVADRLVAVLTVTVEDAAESEDGKEALHRVFESGHSEKGVAQEDPCSLEGSSESTTIAGDLSHTHSDDDWVGSHHSDVLLKYDECSDSFQDWKRQDEDVEASSSDVMESGLDEHDVHSVCGVDKNLLLGLPEDLAAELTRESPLTLKETDLGLSSFERFQDTKVRLPEWSLPMIEPWASLWSHDGWGGIYN